MYIKNKTIVIEKLTSHRFIGARLIFWAGFVETFS